MPPFSFLVNQQTFLLNAKSLRVRRTFLSKKANLLKQITLVPEAILCKTKLASWKSFFLLMLFSFGKEKRIERPGKVLNLRPSG